MYVSPFFVEEGSACAAPPNKKGGGRRDGNDEEWSSGRGSTKYELITGMIHIQNSFFATTCSHMSLGD